MNNEYKIFSLNKFRKIKSNYYNSKDECIKYSGKYGKDYQTNPKFEKFDQTYYYAGDTGDISKYGLLPLRYVYSDTESEYEKSEKIFKLFKKIDYHSIENTFHYIFNKFKKGIFVIIRDNKLIVFLPFSNAKYKNNWVKQTYFSESEKRLLENEDYDKIKNELNKNIIEFQKKYPEQFKYHKINFKREDWYANNCILRNQFPNYEGELNINVIKDMLETLLLERTIPNVEFFMNDRDFPILKKDLTEPYSHLFDSDNVKIEEDYQFKKMCPIFSKSATDDFADILMPTNDDWIMASNKYFTSSCSNGYHKEMWNKINTKWASKINICIFRGSATGCGITLDTNMRLKAADISIDYPDLLDAAITNWKSRPRKYMGKPIEIINVNQFRFKLGNEIDNTTKSNYKYILNIDGYVSAFRLSSELSMNSAILLVDSDYKLWFSDLLKPYVHYIPIKNDLEDLISQIKWCQENDLKCKKIAENALQFHKEYLSKDSILNYMQKKLCMIHTNKNLKNLLDIKPKKINIAIISCFRDKGDGERERERKIFIQLMNKLLAPYCNFKIYIIEQSNDEEAFNIGKLKNIGFELANSETKYDNYIFSDIDSIPDYNLMEYICTKYKYPLSLAIRGTRYEKKNIINNKIIIPFLGAMVQFTDKLFVKINGYPNNFWGWGGEDTALLNRLISNNIEYLYYPKNGAIIDFEENLKMTTINDIKIKVDSEIKNTIKYEKLHGDLNEWKRNGINTLHYKILNKTIINDNTIQIKVDLLKKDDMKKYPYLFPKMKNDWESIKKNMSKYIKNIKIEYI